MFVCVLYGDCEELIVNPQCRINVFLKAIRQRCKCSPDVTLDLSSEIGEMKHLSKYPTKYASDYVSHREKLILVAVKKTAAQESIFIPLLKSKEKDFDFISRLNRKPTLGVVSRMNRARRMSDMTPDSLSISGILWRAGHRYPATGDGKQTSFSSTHHKRFPTPEGAAQSFFASRKISKP